MSAISGPDGGSIRKPAHAAAAAANEAAIPLLVVKE